jgi:hypothetical protein
MWGWLANGLWISNIPVKNITLTRQNLKLKIHLVQIRIKSKKVINKTEGRSFIV